jgi:hypothetical protein
MSRRRRANLFIVKKGHNSLAVPIPREGRIATLWQLTWNDDRVKCVVYQSAEGMQLRLESATGVIMSEPFEMQPRSFARTRALRESLKRRGWREADKRPV